MGCEFTVMERQLEAPRGPIPGGKLVLSRLAPGSSPIGAPAPSLKLVLDGDERYEIDGRSIAVRPGEMLYLDAGSPCIGTNRTAMTGLCLLLPHPPGAAAGSDDPLLGRALVLSARTSGLGRMLLDHGRRIAADPALGAKLADDLIARVAEALAEPLAESRAAMDGLNVAKASTRRELHRRLERARGFLHAHDHRTVALGEMAAAAGLSQFHLARYFKAAFGRSPIAYHRGLRLARAADLLAGGGCSVAEAAELVGLFGPGRAQPRLPPPLRRAAAAWASRRGDDSPSRAPLQRIDLAQRGQAPSGRAPGPGRALPPPPSRARRSARRRASLPLWRPRSGRRRGNCRAGCARPADMSRVTGMNR